jgi:hypothetical protein
LFCYEVVSERIRKALLDARGPYHNFRLEGHFIQDFITNINIFNVRDALKVGEQFLVNIVSDCWKLTCLLSFTILVPLGIGPSKFVNVLEEEVRSALVINIVIISFFRHNRVKVLSWREKVILNVLALSIFLKEPNSVHSSQNEALSTIYIKHLGLGVVVDNFAVVNNVAGILLLAHVSQGVLREQGLDSLAMGRVHCYWRTFVKHNHDGQVNDAENNEHDENLLGEQQEERGTNPQLLGKVSDFHLLIRIVVPIAEPLNSPQTA